MKKRWVCLLAALGMLLSFAAAAESWDQVMAALLSDAPNPVPAQWRLTAEEGRTGARRSPEGNLRNILLLSTDAPDLKENLGRSDLMILCSVNAEAGEMKLISLPETLPVAVRGLPEEIRLKYANCFGGPLLTMETVGGFLDLDIARYCAVNEQALIGAVDLMGGVRLELTDSEREALDLALEETLLSGDQAMRYMRLRRDQGDWERPRKLLEALVSQAFESGLDAAFAQAEKLLPAIDTNLTTSDVVDLLFALLGGEEPPAVTALSLDAKDAEDAAGWMRRTLYGGT